MRVSPWPFVPAPNARGTEDGQVLRNLGLGFITRAERAHSVQATATKPARFGYATRLLGLLLRSYGKASLTLVRRDFPNISPLALKRDTRGRAKTKPNTKRPLIGCCTAPWSTVAPCSGPAHTAASAGCSSPLPSLCLTARPPVLLSSGAAAFARPRSASVDPPSRLPLRVLLARQRQASPLLVVVVLVLLARPGPAAAAGPVRSGDRPLRVRVRRVASGSSSTALSCSSCWPQCTPPSCSALVPECDLGSRVDHHELALVGLRPVGVLALGVLVAQIALGVRPWCRSAPV